MPDLKGSPPLTRGIPGNIKTLGGATRFTPAHAGNTLPHLPDRRLSQVHPRSRGEYTCKKLSASSSMGSPPLTRGIQVAENTFMRKPRFTPAHAGNTANMSLFGATWKVHPRSRGEYEAKNENNKHFEGSPPLTRGIH